MFVSCVRACEAVRVREAGVPYAGDSNAEIDSSGAGFVFSFFDAIRVGFKGKYHPLMLYAWVLKEIH